MLAGFIQLFSRRRDGTEVEVDPERVQALLLDSGSWDVPEGDDEELSWVPLPPASWPDAEPA